MSGNVWNSEPLDDTQAARTSVVHLAAVVRHRWWMPLGSAALALLLVVAAGLLLPPKYRTAGLVQLGMYADQAADPRSRRDLDNLLRTHRGLLQSDEVVDRAIQAAGAKLAPEPRRAEQRAIFMMGLEVMPTPDTFLVEVAAEGSDPRDLARRLNALMAAQVSFTNDFLGSRAVELERLRAKEERLARRLSAARGARDDLYGKVGDVADRRAQLLASLQEARARLTQVDLDLAQAEAHEGQVRRRIDRIETAGSAGDLLGIARGARDRQSERERVLAELRARMLHMRGSIAANRLEELPAYLSLNDELQAQGRFLREELLQESEAQLAAAAEQVQTLARWRGQVEGLMERTRSELARLAILEDRHGAILREVAWYETELEETRAGIRELEGEMPVEGAEVINRAAVPTAPLPRTKPVALLFFMLLALGGGAALAVVLDRFEDTVSDGSELARLGLPVLGHAGRLAIVWGRLREEALEALSLVRTNLRVALGGSGEGVILVTSGHERAGIAFVGLHLAASLARRGQRVVLVEAALSRPRLEWRLRLPAGGVGLGDVLAGAATLEEAVRPSGVQGVSLLAAGAARDDATELLAEADLGALMRQLRERWTHVVVAGPAALPAADVSMLAPHVDGTVHVVRLHRSPRRTLVAAVEQVSQVGGRNLGFVLTDAGGDATPSPALGRGITDLIGAPPQVAAAPAGAAGGAIDLTPAAIARLEDRVELVVRRLMDGRLTAVAAAPAPAPAPAPPRNGEISRLERQIAGLMARLEQGNGGDHRRRRGHPGDVGGLDGQDPMFAKKSALLQQVFDENLALQSGDFDEEE